MQPKVHFFKGPIENSYDLVHQAIKISRKCPGRRQNKFIAVLFAGDALYLYCYPSGHSHLTVRMQALRAQRRRQLPGVEFCVVLGRCRLRHCSCTGRHLVHESSQRRHSSVWYTDDLHFPHCFDLATMLFDALERLEQFQALRAEVLQQMRQVRISAAAPGTKELPGQLTQGTIA